MVILKLEYFGILLAIYLIYPILYLSWLTLVARLWLLFFTINHSIAAIAHKWQEVIAAKAKCNNYFLNEKRSTGTWNALKWKIFAYAAVGYFFDLGYGFITETSLENSKGGWVLWLFSGVVYYCLMVLVPMGLLVRMTYDMNRVVNFHDNIGLGRELKFCTLFSCPLAIGQCSLSDLSP